MILKVGQKVRYDNKIEGFISKIINENEFEVDWLDGTVSTEYLKDMQKNSLEFIDIESSNFRLDRRTSFRKEDIKMVEDYIKPVNPLNTLHTQVKPEATLADYIKSIENKYPEEVNKPKYPHYFKDVSNVNKIDIYKVLDLWQVTHPCLQHAAKKILVAGNRGHKDIAKDVQEAIDSLERYKEMIKESNNG